MARAVIILGWALLLAGAGLILLGLVSIALIDGVGAVRETLNPFNIANFVAMVITLAPGILLISWGEKLAEKQRRKKKLEMS
jgi:hypothetical protein